MTDFHASLDAALRLAAHEDVTFDLTIPRQFTKHGGWNMSCQCGHHLGDSGDHDEAMANHSAHVAAVAKQPTEPPAASMSGEAVDAAGHDAERRMWDEWADGMRQACRDETPIFLPGARIPTLLAALFVLTVAVVFVGAVVWEQVGR